VNIPNSLILDFRNDIAKFKNVLRKNNIDVIDTENLLEHFFITIKKEEDSHVNIYDVIDTFLALAANDLEGVFDEYDFCDKGFYLLNDLLLELLFNMHDKIKYLKLYLNGKLPFNFAAILENNSVLLEKG